MVATRFLSPAPAAPTARSESSAPARKRAYFVDILRLIASFQMVNGHTLDAVLLDSARGGALWDEYVWFRGLVSVSFMFVAGFAFHLATLARFDAHRGRPSEVRRRFRRGGDIILVGYLLHVPYDYLHRWNEVPAKAIDGLVACDVLQCIGLTLIVLEALTVLAPRPETVARAALALSIGLVAVAPLADGVVPDGPWRPLLAYVTHQGGSPFPVIPWASFMLMGCFAGFWAMPRGADTQWRVSISRLMMLALALWGLRYAMEATPWSFATASTHPSARPAFIVERLAAVTAIIAALNVLARPIQRFPAFLRTLSGESLFLYVFHLVLIFSLPFGVHATLGRSLTLPQGLALSFVMVLLTGACGLAWARLKRWREQRRCSAAGEARERVVRDGERRARAAAPADVHRLVE